MIALGHIGLGLVANGRRTVTPVPTALLKLVPKPEDKNITLKKNADTLRDTVPLMLSKIKRTSWQSKKLAAVLKGNSIAQTLRNDWNFIFNHIQYKQDEKGKEQVRSPRRLIHEGSGDCDCFSTTIGTFIHNQGIKGKLRIAKYAGAKEFSHVYIVVPKDGNLSKPLTNRKDYFVIDPVVHQFDYEEQPSEVKDFPLNGMELQSLDGPLSINGLAGNNTCYKGGKNVGNDLVRVAYLEEEGVITTEKFLKQLGVPFTVSTMSDGAVRYIASKKNGDSLVIPPILGPQQQKELAAQLAESCAPTSTDASPSSKSNWVLWLLGISAGVVLLSGGNKNDKPKESSINGLSGRAKARLRKA